MSARAAIQRLRVEASDRADDMQLRGFSALSQDQTRLYVPTSDGKLLLLSLSGIECALNGDNQDRFWVEHPYDDPLQFSSADPVAGLNLFERLLVDTQACMVPARRWLVAMDAGLVPFIRESCAARFLMELIEKNTTRQDKRGTTFHAHARLGTGERRLLGRCPRKSGDIGLLRLDNKEQAAFTQTLIDYCPLPGYRRGARPRSGRWGASPDRFRAPRRRHYYRRY